MATKNAVTKSVSGGSSSHHDVEIEKRLQALEEKAHTPCGGGGDAARIAALEARLAEVVAVLKQAVPGSAKNL